MLVALDKVVAGTVGITYLWVALGSAIGGSARYMLSGVVASWLGATFPWGTLIVNVTGCFVSSSWLGCVEGIRHFLPSVWNAST